MNNKFTKIFDIISKTKGDVLDIGFGWGISANHFYNNGVLKSYPKLFLNTNTY